VAPLRVFSSPSITTARVYSFGFGEDLDRDQEGGQSNAPAEEKREPSDRLEPGYSSISQQYATYLTTLKRPEGVTGKEFRKFKAEALKFIVLDGHLFRRASKNIPLRRVVDNETDRSSILRALHEDSGHRGREGTYRRVADRYWWNDLAKDVARHCKTCEACQKREPGHLPLWNLR
jgi:hypothetical protein